MQENDRPTKGALADAVLLLNQTMGEHAELTKRLCALLAAPNLVQRLTAGRVNNAIAALIIVVSLSAVIGATVAMAWNTP